VAKRPLWGKTDFAEVLGQRICERRTTLGFTLRELEQRSDVDDAYISLLEHAERPRVAGEIVTRLAEALETSCDYLWGLTDDPRPRRDAGRELTVLELMLVERFRSLPEDAQRFWLNVLELSLESQGLEPASLIGEGSGEELGEHEGK